MMIIIGDELVSYEDIFFISSKDEIKNTKANSTIAFGYNEELLKYSLENSLSSAVEVKTIKEAIYVNALEGKYIIAEKNLAISLQKIADNYMFDSKILALIDSNDEFEEVANNEIDGVIYKNLLK